MKEYQRHLVLLLGFMALLTGVFVFLVEYSPESLELTPEEPNSSSEVEIETPDNEFLNMTISGLTQLFSDSQEGLAYFSGAGEGS